MTCNRHVPHLDLVTLLQSFSCLSSTARYHPMMPPHPYQFPRATTHATATSMRKSSWWGQWWWLNVWSLENPEVFLSSISCYTVLFHNSIGRCVAASLHKWDLVPWFQHGWNHHHNTLPVVPHNQRYSDKLDSDPTEICQQKIYAALLLPSQCSWMQLTWRKAVCSAPTSTSAPNRLQLKWRLRTLLTKGRSSNPHPSLLGRRYRQMDRNIAIVPNCVKVNHSTLHPLGWWSGFEEASRISTKRTRNRTAPAPQTAVTVPFNSSCSNTLFVHRSMNFEVRTAK